MDSARQNFFDVSAHKKTGKVPLALIVDSPWLPGYAGIDTLDYYLDENLWFDINLRLLEQFPGIVWVPGFWWEYGMAIEASAFGSRLLFHHDQPPSVEPLSKDLHFWAEHIRVQDPEKDGLMPLVLRQIERMDRRLEPYDAGQNIACARGIMTVTSWFMGVPALMESLISDPEVISPILEKVTDTIILWLDAQLKRMREPRAVMVLDDLVGMISRRQYARMIEPLYKKIWDHFDSVIRIYHNDTPCEHLLPTLAEDGFDVFNFSHETDIASARKLMGDRIVLMGNVPPRDLGALGTPEQNYHFAMDCLIKSEGKGLILSFGGGVSPNTRPENIRALAEALKDWENNKSEA